MGTVTSRNDKRKSSLNERILLKKAWTGIEDNPQYHGNVFFLGFCERYPQYSKYFTMDPEMPLTIDVRISTHFSIIMETMGYLIVDSYNKPKEFKHYIGYIAMVHKDMNLVRSDLSNFAVSLVEYLTVTYPLTMTPECRKVVARYIHYLVDEISEKIEEFRRFEPLDQYELSRQMSSDNLVYGQPVEYWIERKRVWDERLEEWKLQVRTTIDPIKSSSTDDDITPPYRSRIAEEEEETPESMSSLQLLKKNDSSQASRQLLSFDNVGVVVPSQRRVTLRTKKSGQTTYDVVEAMNLTNVHLTSPTLEFSSEAIKEELSIKDDRLPKDNQLGASEKSTSDIIKSLEIDSIARRRRRRRQ